MLQKLELQQLQQLQRHSLEEVKAYKKQVIACKAELEALKTKGGKAWTDELQDELDDVALFLVDIDDVIEKKEAAKAKTEKSTYVPKAGTEKMVHLSIVHGRRFNPLSGREESAPFTQMFTFAEWQLFKKNFKGLGYTIIKVLHDPYGDAAELVVKR